MKSFLKSALAVAAASLCFSAQAVLIDDFNDPAFPGAQIATDTRKDAGFTVGASSNHAGAGIIGGERELFVIKQIGTDSSTLGITATVESGVYSFNSASGNAGVGIIRWDGVNTGFGQVGADSVLDNIDNAVASIDGSGFASTDLASGSAGAFVVDVLSSDGGFNFTMQVWSNGGTKASTLTLSASAGNNIQYVIPFFAFSLFPSQCLGGMAADCADFTQVTALQAVINWPGNPTDGPLGNPVMDIDLRIDIVDNVTPEPAGLALAGLALVAAGVARRRKNAR